MNQLTAQTIPDIYFWRMEQQPDGVAGHIKTQGQYQPITWSQYHQDVCRAAAVLSPWVQPGSRVVHVSENRYEWLVADLAILLLGGVHVPLHSTLTVAQQLDQATDAQPSCLIRSNADGLQISNLPTLCYHPEPTDGTISWGQAIREADAQQGLAAMRAACKQVQPTSIATILYTSGTTGESKGVVLTQANLASNAMEANNAFHVEAGKKRMNFLPLSHIFARTCDLYAWLVGGYQLILAESKDTVVADCHATSPHIITGVPYFFERIQRGLQAAGVAAAPGALKKALGGSIELCCSGGAPLPDETFDYYASQGIPLLQGYGLTETSPVISANTPTAMRRGSVGQVIKDVQVRIAEDGEICAKGPNIMVGYWRKPEATAEVLRDGWFATGDIGHLDEDGYLWITGRKKELIVTAAGKKIAPVLVESLLNQDPLIAQSFVFGDRQKYLIALIVPEPAALSAKLKELGLTEESWQGEQVHPQIMELIEASVRSRLSNLSHYEQIQRFCILRQPFSIESGELTPKLSLRRPIILERYAQEIRSLYE